MTDKELERLHLLATLKTYGPSEAEFIRERANDEAAHDAFDPIDTIASNAIGLKLVALRQFDMASYDAATKRWAITPYGAVILQGGLDELDGVVDPTPLLSDEDIEQAAHELYAGGPWGRFVHFEGGGVTAVHDSHTMDTYRSMVRCVLDAVAFTTTPSPMEDS